MDVLEVGVLIGGIALIGLSLWYFFGERSQTNATVGKGGVQEVDIIVRGGYSPDTIVLRAGIPVRLNFYRDETDSCSEKVILGDFGIARDLTPYQTTTIEFTPQESGDYTFACGMNMLRGKVVVREDEKR